MLMYKDGLKIAVFSIAMMLALLANAQLYQYGINIGYNLSKFKTKSAEPTEDLIIINERSKSGGSFGFQFQYGPPKDQAIKGFHIIPSILAEVSACLCGAKLLTGILLPDSTRTIRSQDFSFLRVDFSPKFLGTMRNFEVVAGPTLSKIFLAELDLSGTDQIVEANGFFSPIIIGYEVGFGYRLNTISFSARMQSNITGFGKSSIFLPTDFSNRQYRIMIHYYFLEKHRGSYLDTIYW